MKQTLHIFAKDTRRFWLEILLSIAVLAIYAVRYTVSFRAPIFFGQQSYMLVLRDLDSLIIVLVPAVWWLLIGRVIQAEGLTGDSQWWLTRPYDWKSLLAAKSLFLLVWVYIPFVLAQMLVLARAGLAPLGHASHWSLLVLFVSGCVMFPLIAIAAVTTNFARMTLTLLGVLVALIAFNFVATAYAPAYWAAVPYPHHLYIVAVLLLGGFIVTLQYATRRVWLARALLVSVAALTAGVGLILSAMRQGEVDRQFPAADAAATAPIQVAFQPSESNPLLIYPAQRTGMLYIQLPLEFSGVAEGSAVEIEDEKFTMDSADGQHWTSPWRLAGNLQFLSGTYRPGVPIMMGRRQYERFKSQPMTLQLTLAVTELHAASETRAAFSEGDFRVSGYGVCAGTRQWYLNRAFICRTEVGRSQLTYVTTTWSKYPCSGPQPGPPDAISGMAWTGKVYSDPLDSVWNPLVLSLVQPEPHHSGGRLAGTQDLTICPGTAVHFTQYSVTNRTQVSLTIPNFQLPPEPR